MADSRQTYTREFKLAAVRMITDQQLPVAEAARRGASPQSSSAVGEPLSVVPLGGSGSK